MHGRAHMDTHMHRHRDIGVRRCVHRDIHVNTCVCTWTQTRVHMDIHVSKHVCTWIHVCSDVHAQGHACTGRCVHTDMRVPGCVCTRTRVCSPPQHTALYPSWPLPIPSPTHGSIPPPDPPPFPFSDQCSSLFHPPFLPSSSSSPPPSPSSTPGGDPPQKEGGFGGAEPCAKGKDLHKDASNNRASLGPGDRAERQSGAAAGPAASQRPPPEPPAPSPALAGGLGPDPPGEAAEPRREHFDRLIRQSKLWCYAKGFNVDGKSLRHGGRTEPCKAAELKSPGSKRAESPGTLSNKALRGNGSERNAKRRRLARGAEAERQQSSSKGRPQKTQRRNAKKGNTHCKRLGSAGPTPPRNSFSLMGNFPCIPSLVVGEDGDLCPASSLGGKNSWALSKTHPLWRWHLGGNAIPVPPSLKFRGYSLEDL